MGALRRRLDTFATRALFGDVQSFGDKVVGLATFVSGIAIVVVSIALAINDYRQSRNSEIAAVHSHALIVAMNSSAPLAFDDRANAREALSALRVAPNVAAAALFDEHGDTFASYRRDAGGAPVFAPEAPGLRSQGGWLVYVEPIADRGQQLGNLEVVFELGQTRERLWATMLSMIVAASAAMVLVFGLARKMKDLLVEPIRDLGRTAHKISETKNYRLRANKRDDDEIGELTDAFNDMLAQIEQQNTQIQAARGEAERASQLKDEFLATLSHELRTPLTPILGWVQILQRLGTGNPQVQQAAEVIERNVRAQTQIVNDLLDMSRIISGKVRLELAPTDLADVIEAAIDTVSPTAVARGVHLLTSLDRSTGVVRADPNRLQQVVWNLLSNAIKFTPSGGRVTVSLKRAGDAAQIVVADTGQGIEAEFLPHVFERFRQADSSTTREHGGLGIGLAIVRQLVEMHAGAVRAESGGRDRGTVFTVEFPLMRAESGAATGESARAAPPAPVPAPRPDALAGMRVLVVDDDRDARGMLSQMLGAAGADVQCAESAAEALREIARSKPDVLLSDIGMPELDGYGLIEAIRRLPSSEGGAVPAIALTAFARGADSSRALAAGFQRHLAKPVDEATLIAAVAGVVRG